MNRKRTNEDILESSESTRTKGRNLKVGNKLRKIRTIDDSTGGPNIMSMTKEERLEYIRTHENPYHWPKEYYDIYVRESMIRHPDGFNGTMRIDGIKLFQAGDDQILGKEKIQEMNNVNCIKSRHLDDFEVDDITFGDFVKNFFESKGQKFYQDYDEFVDDYIENMGEEEIDYYEIGKTLLPLYNEYRKSLPNKYVIIIALIKEILGEYAQYVCIAGGFSLSKHMYETYNMEISFGDIDLFIHSCDQETANKIIHFLTKITNNGIYTNENVLMSLFNNTNNTDSDYIADFPISLPNNKSIQIIKRIYRSPAEIILGFDVDSCCMLTTLDNETYATERCCYSIKHAYNVLNFDRMSPSYEYRLIKYNKRGFAIWIPFIEHFKSNAVFDNNALDDKKISYVIIRGLIRSTEQIPYQYRYQHTNKKFIDIEASDYYSKLKHNELYKNEHIEFKYLDPSAQITSTYHKLVLEDPIEWYPVRHPQTLDHVSINDKGLEVREIVSNFSCVNISAMNMIGLKKRSNGKSITCINAAFEFINYINNYAPGSTISGGLVNSAITGKSFYEFNIFNSGFDTVEKQQRFVYHTYQFKFLLHLRNRIRLLFPEHHDININELGRFVFRKSEDSYDSLTDIINDENISDEENFNRFKNDNNVRNAYITFNRFSNLEGYQNHLFFPSEKLKFLIESYVNSDKFFNIIYSGDINIFKSHMNNSNIKAVINDGNYKNGYMAEFYNKFMIGLGSELAIQRKETIDRLGELIDQIIDKKMKKKQSKYSYKYGFDSMISTNVLPKAIKNLIHYDEEKLVHKLAITSRMYDIFMLGDIFQSDPSVLNFLAYKKILNVMGYSIDISFALRLDDNFVQDGIFYNDGKFYGTEYDCYLASIGISHDDISKGKVKIDSGPIWQQFIAH